MLIRQNFITLLTELLSGERISTTCLAVLTSYWTVTDRQTDRQTNRHTDEYFAMAYIERYLRSRG